MSDFSKLFKPDDVICSDHFYNGKLLLVKELKISINNELRYMCEDMREPEQKWLARQWRQGYHEGKPYDWRLATDDDYVRDISRCFFTTIDASDSGYITTSFSFDDNEVTILGTDQFVILTPEQAIVLRDAITKYVGVDNG